MGAILYWVLTVYWLVLIARLIMDWVLAFNPGMRPSGPVAMLFDGVYSMTDPLLKPLRRLIPPLRIGNFALDLSFLVLIFAVGIARGYLA